MILPDRLAEEKRKREQVTKIRCKTCGAEFVGGNRKLAKEGMYQHNKETGHKDFENITAKQERG